MAATVHVLFPEGDTHEGDVRQQLHALVDQVDGLLLLALASLVQSLVSSAHSSSSHPTAS